MTKVLYGIKDASNITVYSNTTLKPILHSNYCSLSSIGFTMDSVFALNKGVKSIRWDKSKEGKLTTEMELFESKWLAMLFGTEFATTTIPVFKKEVLNVVGGTVTLGATPATSSLSVFKVDSLDKLEHKSEQLIGNPATTVDKYSISGLTLTFNTSTTFTTNADYVVCYYTVNSAVSNFSVMASSYPSGYKLVLDTAMRGTDQVDAMVQITLPNCKPQTNIDIEMSVDNCTKLKITWDVMADGLGNMMTFAKI